MTTNKEIKDAEVSQDKEYNISFEGTLKGSLGVREHFKIITKSPNEKAAELKLYDDYDHIINLIIKELV